LILVFDVELAGKTLQQARVGLLIAQFEALPEVDVGVGV
jgi:hypothetical protein